MSQTFVRNKNKRLGACSVAVESNVCLVTWSTQSNAEHRQRAAGCVLTSAEFLSSNALSISWNITTLDADDVDGCRLRLVEVARHDDDNSTSSSCTGRAVIERVFPASLKVSSVLTSLCDDVSVKLSNAAKWCKEVRHRTGLRLHSTSYTIRREIDV